jgi:hypothetical protein
MHIRTWLKPQLGHLPLDRLNAGHIEELFATLRASLNAAVKQRKITWNPCNGVELEQPETAERQRWTPAASLPPSDGKSWA